MVVFNGGVSDGGGDSPGFGAARIESREQFGIVMRAVRELSGLTIRQVAKSSEVSHGTLSGWFGGTAVPARDAAPHLARVLEVCGAADQFAVLWAAANRVRDIPRPARAKNSPYRGLEAYRAEDAELFFGRDDLVAELGARVVAGLTGEGPRLIGVPGASGSGKSSVLQAGLLVALAELKAPAWRMVPGADPGAALNKALEALDDRDQGAVLIVDQAEELWTYTDTAKKDRPVSSPAQFVQRLVDLTGTGVVVVFALRADFFAHAFTIPALERALTTDAVPVGPMSKEQLEEAITKPVEKLGGVETALVEVLLDELAVAGGGAHDPGALPLLSHALDRTWAKRRTMTQLTVAHYCSTGGIREAIGKSAEKVWKELDARQRRAAERLFVRAARRGDTGLVRILVRPTELDWPDIDGGTTELVIGKFVTARLLTTTDEGVQITHEALLHAWKRLRDWIDEDAAGHALHLRLAELTRLWDPADPSTLLGPARTKEYQRWQTDPGQRRCLTVAESEFVAKSAAHHAAEREREHQQLLRERRQIRRRQISAGALFLVVALLIGTVVLVVRARSEAVAQRQEIWSRTLAQAAERHSVTRDPDPLDLQLALASYEVSAREDLANLIEGRWDGARRWRSGIKVNAAAVAQDSSLLALTDGTTIKVTDRRRPRDGTHHAQVDAMGLGGRISAIAFRPHTHLLATAAGTEVVLVDIDSPGQVVGLPGTTASVRDLVWDPTGTELAAASDAGVIRWRFDGRTWQRADALNAAIAIDYSADGRQLAAVRPDGSGVELWERDHATGHLRVLDPIVLAVPDTMSGSVGGSPQPQGITDIAFARLSETPFKPVLVIVTARDYAQLVTDQQEVIGVLLAGVGTGLAAGAHGFTAGITKGAGRISMYELFGTSPSAPVDSWSMGGGEYELQAAGAATSTVAVADEGQTFIVTTQDGMVYEWQEPIPPPDPTVSVESVRAAICADSTGLITAEEWQTMVPEVPFQPFC
ncbi:helix-turn-helix domain-containing protein [Nocardia neocaledoniensis]|uniref:nSTAND1 domain-containing NTPase n=1 Tax=Nocardia neocaledoniensis TaxID=236511 RepID=UPI00340D034F